ncbi:protein FAM151A [Synchiropus picturatus]
MLDYLVQTGEIEKPDGLLAKWFHRANSKEEMNKALESDAMILEADVTLEGYGTPNEKPVPIMAHPPSIYSNNTLDEWLDAVLSSRKGVKLDFKALKSVGLSLDLLRQKNQSRGINRPVWLNADILVGPNVPSYMPTVNGTRFLQLIQEKFPDVTLSTGWMVGYAPPFFTNSYSRAMVEDMYNMVKDLPQMVTFPVHALLVRKGWQHISWLLSQSSRFSLTLWQGSTHPNVSDLLFVRDNSHPARVYYDIYEPTLSEFQQAARQMGRVRSFYPGGDLMDFLDHKRRNKLSMNVRWLTVTDRDTLSAALSDSTGGMLVIKIGSTNGHPDVPLVEPTVDKDTLRLQDVLQLLQNTADVSWGLYLRVPSMLLLEASLRELQSAYSRDELHRPVWISLEGSLDFTQEFVSVVERTFPYVTLVLEQRSWPPVIPSAMTGLSQRVALHLRSRGLPKRELHSLVKMMDSYDVLFEEDPGSRDATVADLKELVTKEGARGNLYLECQECH